MAWHCPDTRVTKPFGCKLWGNKSSFSLYVLLCFCVFLLAISYSPKIVLVPFYSLTITHIFWTYYSTDNFNKLCILGDEQSTRGGRVSINFFSLSLAWLVHFSGEGGEGCLFPQSPGIRTANATNCKKPIEQIKGLDTLQTNPTYFEIQNIFLLRLYMYVHDFVIKFWRNKYIM